MSIPSSANLDHVLLRFGDDLFRLALLLAPGEGGAAAALVKAAPRLATAGAETAEHALIAALLDCLPPERRGWRRPAWATPLPKRAGGAPLLAALARLPRRQRLALGLTLLRGADAAQAAVLLDGDESAVREQVRDALLALAPYAGFDVRARHIVPSRTTNDEKRTAPRAAALDAEIPEDCRPTRAALALGDMSSARPEVRGHLALCESCRAAEHAWLHLTAAVEAALRGALRDAQLPGELAERMRSAGVPAYKRGLLADVRLRIGLVSLVVLALIAVLIAPHGGAISSIEPGSAAPPPRELVRRASEYLYTPPAGAGIWHAHYEMRWMFANNTYAPLAADQWIEPATGRHRLQLVHHDGGGPYELELADGARSAWYAVAASYAPSLYPLSVPQTPPYQITFPATPDEQRELLRARLQSGAWDLAAAYLRQAEATPDLQAWGRQRSPDGTIVSLISFGGVSPLAPPPDAPDAPGPITIMLALDEGSGRLREVRELLGPAGGEQVTYITWRFVDEEWIGEQAAAERIFDLREAWNGVGDFIERDRPAHPALPLAQQRAITPLALAIQRSGSGLWLPARMPGGVDAALLLNSRSAPLGGNVESDSQRLTLVYISQGRRLELRTARASSEPTLRVSRSEISSLDGHELALRAGAAQSYEAQISHERSLGEALVTRVSARGYTRAELLDLLETLGPPTLEVYRSQARLLADAHPHDTAFEALLGALAPRADSGGAAQRTIARVFARQGGAPDPLADPYHRPRYDGIPEHLIEETWTRATPAGGSQASISMRDATGRLYRQLYADGRQVWRYAAPLSQIEQFDSGVADLGLWYNQPNQILLNMLGCGQATLLSGAEGGSTVSLSDTDWRANPCQHPSYPDILRAQISDFPTWAIDQPPYLADLRDQAITTWVDLNAGGRIIRAETRAGTARDGQLLEAWELERDEPAPAGSFSESIFDPTPPAALVRWRNPGGIINIDLTLREITTAEALDRARTPLFGLPDEISPTLAAPAGTLTTTAPFSATLLVVEAGARPGSTPHLYDDNESAPLSALRAGYAIRLTYRLSRRDSSSIVQIYQGPAREFGAYLRATARWLASTPITLIVDGRPTPGWQIAGIKGGRWTLFEVDGTLIAIEYPFEQAAEIAAGLERLVGR